MRERPMSAATARKTAPARREKAKTANAIANAAAAWSLGNDGSVVLAPRTWVSAEWVANGRGRSQRCDISWFARSATAAATSAEAEASFQRTGP
jgi:hypothetical protein